LEKDTISECTKYGKVKGCKVLENLSPDCPLDESVSVFVAFFNQESAVRAFKDMNGRFFGGRQVVAAFYDESKYEEGVLIRSTS
jgi:splicing factor 45